MYTEESEEVELETYTVTVAKDRKTGDILSMEWMNCAGQLHAPSNDIPSYWYTFVDCKSVLMQQWHKAGELHRLGDLPATINYCGDGTLNYEEWFVNGQFHRDGGKPAMIQYGVDNGQMMIEERNWCRDGIMIDYSFEEVVVEPISPKV